MKIRLGYVAIAMTLNVTASRTITYTNYQKLDDESKYLRLEFLIKENIRILKEILKYNFKNHIHFYRISHNLVPLATHKDVDFDYITPYKKLWNEVGRLIKKYDIRVDTHPDQFCVLNSNSKNIVENSILALKFHCELFKALGIEGKMILHVGGAYGDKEKAIKTFVKNFRKLDNEIQKMIILENDDKVFNVLDVLCICETLNIPMVLDYHHYMCNDGGLDIRDYILRIFKTWEGEGLPPKVHFSSPKSKKEYRSHSEYINDDDFIEFINLLKFYDTDVDIMLECKAKDEALFKLVRLLKYKTDYLFIDDTSFEV